MLTGRVVSWGRMNGRHARELLALGVSTVSVRRRVDTRELDAFLVVGAGGVSSVGRRERSTRAGVAGGRACRRFRSGEGSTRGNLARFWLLVSDRCVARSAAREVDTRGGRLDLLACRLFGELRSRHAVTGCVS